MVAVTAGELSPIVAGIVYCNTIAFCRDAYELRRAREWTEALTRWCEQQPDMVAHKGTLPRASGRDHDARRRVAGGARRSASRRDAVRAGSAERACARPRRVPAGGGPSPAGAVRRSRGCVPRGKPLRPRAAARSGADEARPGQGRRGGRVDSASRERDGTCRSGGWRSFRRTSRSLSRSARSPRRARHATSSRRSLARRGVRR